MLARQIPVAIGAMQQQLCGLRDGCPGPIPCLGKAIEQRPESFWSGERRTSLGELWALPTSGSRYGGVVGAR